MSDHEAENTEEEVHIGEEEGFESEEGYESEAAEDEDGEEVVFELLPEHIETIQTTLAWAIEAVGTPHEVGIAIYTAILAKVPTEDKALFKTPLNLIALQFITQVGRLVECLTNQEALNEELYNMSIRHIAYCKPSQLKAYLPAFADATLRTLQGALEDNWTELGEQSWHMLLMFIGKTLYTQLKEFSSKVHTIQRSWNKINNLATTTALLQEAADEAALAEGGEAAAAILAKNAQEENDGKERKKGFFGKFGKRNTSKEAVATKKATAEVTGFGDSLYFNIGVMAAEIAQNFVTPRAALAQKFDVGFSKLVSLITDPAALQEFLYVLAIKHLKYGDVKAELFPVFGQAVMVTARSMLPRAWDYKHEEAWLWMWDTASAFLSSSLETAPLYKQLVDDSIDKLAEVDMEELSFKFYEKVFIVAPEAMRWFYKPQAIVFFIVERVLGLLGNLSHEPERIASEVRSLGMRHIKYNIPPAIFPAFGDALLDVLSLYLEGTWTDDCEAAWASVFNFTCKTMTRAVTMGTNLVTRAVVANSTPMLEDALRVAPRSKRATWVLEIDVLGARLSPLLWALESGKLDIAGVMLDDVLAIRADRQEYYFGKDDLFQTHPDIVGQLLILAPSLVTRLLDGLVWQSRLSEKGQLRRVNFYVEHMYGDPRDPNMADAYKTPLADFVRLASPTMFTHSVISVLLDLKWYGFGSRVFMRSRLAYAVVLVLFMLAYVVMPVPFLRAGDPKTDPNFVAVQVLRWVVCIGNALALVYFQLTYIVSEVRRGQFTAITKRIRVPKSLASAMFVARLLSSVCLLVAASFDPYIEGRVSNITASQTKVYRWLISIASLGLWLLLIDLFELWPRAVLFRFQVLEAMHDFVPLLVTMGVFLMGTGSALFVSDLAFQKFDYTTMEEGTSLGKTVLDSASHVLGNNSFVVSNLSRATQFFYVIGMFLLVVFATSAAMALYTSRLFGLEAAGQMARQRAFTVLATEGYTSLSVRRKAFLRLNFDDKVEFDEGDLGPSGGVQLMQPTSKFEAVDRIQRFPGECSPDVAWPAVKVVGFDLMRVMEESLDISKRLHKQAREHIKSLGIKLGSSMGGTSMGMSGMSSSAGGASQASSAA